MQGSQGEIYSLSQDTVYPSSIMSPGKPSIDSPFAALADAPIVGEWPVHAMLCAAQTAAALCRCPRMA